MNHAQHKFLTTIVVFIIMVVGVYVAAKFKEINTSAMNLVLLLVNSLLLLIVLGILLHVRENFTITIKNRKKS